jgi:O-antigen ligase
VQLWLGTLGLAIAGLALGIILAGAPPEAVLGTLAALLAIGAAIYRPALGLAVLAFAYPYDLKTYAGPVKLTTSAALLAILAIVWVGRQILPNPPAWQATPLDLPVALFAIATVLSLLSLSGHYTDQLVGLLKAGGAFVLFFVTTQSLRERRDLWLVVGAVVATGLIVALQTTVPVLAGTTVVSDATRAKGITIDPNLFGGYLVLVSSLAVAMALTLRERWAMIAGGLAAFIFAIALVATLSRSAWIGSLVALITLIILVPHRRRVLASIGAFIVALVLIVGLAGPIGARLGSQSGDGPFQTFTSRVPIWKAGWDMFLHHPILGIGINNFSNFIGSYDPELDVNQAHNLFVNIAAERGLLGIATFLVVLIMLFVTVAVAIRKAPDFPHRVLVAGMMAGLVGFLVHSLFDVSYYDYKVLLLLWLVVSTVACLPSIFGRQVS